MLGSSVGQFRPELLKVRNVCVQIRRVRGTYIRVELRRLAGNGLQFIKPLPFFPQLVRGHIGVTGVMEPRIALRCSVLWTALTPRV
jgi:hypothetical protein